VKLRVIGDKKVQKIHFTTRITRVLRLFDMIVQSFLQEEGFGWSFVPEEVRRPFGMVSRGNECLFM
jgi:hypothetical protein